MSNATLSRMREAFPDGRQVGAIRIGSGAKWHPAYVDPKYGVTIVCHCPGTQNGTARNKSAFRENVEPTCGK